MPLPKSNEVIQLVRPATHNSQYLSIISPPPPPIAQILKLTLPRSLHFALSLPSSLSPPANEAPLPSLSPIYERLTTLTPAPGCVAGIRLLKSSKARVLIITNGSKATTEGYVSQASLEGVVDGVKSCDEVGVGKPLRAVYESALELCGGQVGQDGEGRMSRWFVAAHMWDLAGARKAGWVLSRLIPSTTFTQDISSLRISYRSIIRRRVSVFGD